MLILSMILRHYRLMMEHWCFKSADEAFVAWQFHRMLPVICPNLRSWMFQLKLPVYRPLILSSILPGPDAAGHSQSAAQ